MNTTVCGISLQQDFVRISWNICTNRIPETQNLKNYLDFFKKAMTTRSLLQRPWRGTRHAQHTRHLKFQNWLKSQKNRAISSLSIDEALIITQNNCPPTKVETALLLRTHPGPANGLQPHSFSLGGHNFWLLASLCVMGHDLGSSNHTPKKYIHGWVTWVYEGIFCLFSTKQLLTIWSRKRFTSSKGTGSPWFQNLFY